MPILYDLFPATVGVLPPHDTRDIRTLTSAPASEGAYQVTRARVIVTEDRIIIAKDTPEGPMPIFSEAYYGTFVKSDKVTEESYIITDLDKKLAFKKDEQCGCGSRLRSWQPFGSGNIMHSKNDPTE